jgi:hypothetical protein
MDVSLARCSASDRSGNTGAMTALLIILVLLALVFGVGAVIEGLAWMFLIVAALIIAAIVLGFRSFGRA